MRERTSQSGIVRLVKGVVAAAVVAGVVLWAVLNSGGLFAAGRQPLRFWCGFTGPDGVTMLRIIKGFNKEHEDAHVTMQRMEWATYYNKLLVAGLGDRAPEVFVIHVTSIPRFRDAGLLEPLDDMFTTGGALNRADFDDNVFQHVVHNGQVFGVPLDVHCSGMYYNPELLAKAGMAGPDGTVTPPETRDEFMDMLRRFPENGPEGTFAFAYGYLEFDMYNFVAQWGGKFLSDDNSRCILDSPANIEAMQFAADLIHKHKLVPPLNRRISWTGFRQGQLGMAWEGVWMIGDLQRVPNLSYKPAVLPQLGPQKGAYASSHVLCVSRGLDPERRKAAEQLIKYLSDNSLDWAEAGQIPVRKSLRDTDRFRAMEVQSVFAQQIPYIMFRPMVPFDSELQSEFKVAVERILYGTETPEVALGRAARNVNAVIKRYEDMKQIQAQAEAEEAE